MVRVPKASPGVDVIDLASILLRQFPGPVERGPLYHHNPLVLLEEPRLHQLQDVAQVRQVFLQFLHPPLQVVQQFLLHRLKVSNLILVFPGSLGCFLLLEEFCLGPFQFVQSLVRVGLSLLERDQLLLLALLEVGDFLLMLSGGLACFLLFDEFRLGLLEGHKFAG